MTREAANKHREAFDAWRDGAEIEYQNAFGDWVALPQPDWDGMGEYRVNPREPRTGKVGVTLSYTGSTCYILMADDGHDLNGGEEYIQKTPEVLAALKEKGVIL